MGMELGKEKLQQTLFTSLFKTIIRVKREDVLQKEVEEINEIAKQKISKLKRKEKCPIGHPIFFATTLQFEKQIKHEKGEDEVAKKKNGNKQMSKIKKLVHKLVLATFMVTHSSCNSKVWHKF